MEAKIQKKYVQSDLFDSQSDMFGLSDCLMILTSLYELINYTDKFNLSLFLRCAHIPANVRL